MIDNLETLIELHRQGTMTKVSTVMRVTQSTVSKRIAAVEDYYGIKLVQKDGRHVRLTSQALSLIERLSPILVELREVMSPCKEPETKRVVVGVSESILSSWGAKLIENVRSKIGIDIEYHTHRSPVVIEKVELGVYDIGICAGKTTKPRSLLSDSLGFEEMVLIAQRLPSKQKISDIISIEKKSATWKSIQTQALNCNLSVNEEMESFFSIAKLVVNSDRVGLVPIGVAKALGIQKKSIRHLRPKVARPLQLIYKKSKLQDEQISELIQMLKEASMKLTP